MGFVGKDLKWWAHISPLSLVLMPCPKSGRCTERSQDPTEQWDQFAALALPCLHGLEQACMKDVNLTSHGPVACCNLMLHSSWDLDCFHSHPESSTLMSKSEKFLSPRGKAALNAGAQRTKALG